MWTLSLPADSRRCAWFTYRVPTAASLMYVVATCIRQHTYLHTSAYGCRASLMYVVAPTYVSISTCIRQHTYLHTSAYVCRASLMHVVATYTRAYVSIREHTWIHAGSVPCRLCPTCWLACTFQRPTAQLLRDVSICTFVLVKQVK